MERGDGGKGGAIERGGGAEGERVEEEEGQF